MLFRFHYYYAHSHYQLSLIDAGFIRLPLFSIAAILFIRPFRWPLPLAATHRLAIIAIIFIIVMLLLPLLSLLLRYAGLRRHFAIATLLLSPLLGGFR